MSHAKPVRYARHLSRAFREYTTTHSTINVYWQPEKICCILILRIWTSLSFPNNVSFPFQLMVHATYRLRTCGVHGPCNELTNHTSYNGAFSLTCGETPETAPYASQKVASALMGHLTMIDVRLLWWKESFMFLFLLLFHLLPYFLFFFYFLLFLSEKIWS